MIRLVTKDDGYEPDRSIVNTRQLINEDKVFLLIGGVGTPTAKVIVPICEEAKVPFVGAFTGAGLLRSPGLEQIVSLRASYNQEMERLAQYLVEEKGLSKIACFYQNDAYGQAGLGGIREGLEKRNLELVATGTYERNTVAVKTGLLDIRKGKPEAIVMVGAYKACSEFIKLAKKVGLKDTVYCNISFVGTKALQKELGADGEGVVISQVVPRPVAASLPVIDEYRTALKKHFPDKELDWVSLEGYLVGRMFVELAKDAGKDLNRAAFLKSVSSAGALDLGGFGIAFGPGDFQGSERVYLTVLQGDEVQPIDADSLAAR